jgi:leucyl-tRNA synthetase
MCVPAHDDRDKIFARAHHLEIVEVIKDSKVISGALAGRTSEEATETLLRQLPDAKKTVKYRLRDWLVSRQRYWGAPIPIVYDPDGQPHPVKEEHLPLLLPEDVDFLPGGESPIKLSRDFQDLAEKLYGHGWRFESDTLDTFVDSSWYFFRYLSPTRETEAFDRATVSNWLPVDLCVGGIEHATLHLLYARFITKFLAKFGYIDSKITEPFQALFNIGMVNMNGVKMSKSKGNVISPDPLVEHYGTDALRGYELFLGPMDIEVEWNPRGISGIHRFLIKLWKLAHTVTDETNEFANNQFNLYLNATGPMIKDYRLNIVIAQAMIFINECSKSGISKETLGKFVTTLAPIFPFIAEELYELLGGSNESVFMEKWPAVNQMDGSTPLGKKLNIFIGKKLIATSNTDEPEAEIVRKTNTSYPQTAGCRHLLIDKPNLRILKFFV